MSKTKKNSHEATFLLENEINQYITENNNDYNTIGNNLGAKLKSCNKMVYNSIIPNILEKFCDKTTIEEWRKIISNETMLSELKTIGVSIANTMRPVAGNTFAEWVSIILNKMFIENGLYLQCETKGKYKTEIVKKFKEYKEIVNTQTGELTKMDMKPDIDIVLYHTITKEIKAILSCKTSLAERVLQTISWHNYITNILQDDMPIYLITCWEDFKNTPSNKNRVQSLNGVFVCNEDVEEYGNIKIFSKTIEEFSKFN